MPGPSVTIVESGGIAVVEVESGAPAFTAVESGGIAVTLAASGIPMVIEGGTPPSDSTPDAFSFTDQVGANRSTLVESNAITVAGINTSSTITITGGEYQIGAGSWVSTSGSVTNGQTVKVRLTTSASFSTIANATLTIGGVSDTFSVTTLAQDLVPNAFTFTDVTNVALSTVTESNAITVAGINDASTITITGGEYQKNGGSWVSTSGTVANGDSVKVRGTSSGSNLTAVNVALTIGGVSDTFTITTAAATPAGVRNAPVLSFTSNTTYPPPLVVTLDSSIYENDVLRVQSSATLGGFGTPTINDTSVLDAAAIAGGSVSVTGLSSISSPTQTYFRARVEPPGLTDSDWSVIVKHGDTTAPTITSSASPSVAENTVSPTGTLTANEDIASWTIIGGADAASFSVAGATWTLNATPDYETKTSYVVQFRATDYGGNTADQTMTLGITDVMEATPSQLSTSFKHSLIDVTGSGMIATAQVNNDGGRRGIRSDQARSGKGYFEVLVNNINTINDLTFGVCDVNMVFAGVQFEKPTTKGCYLNEGRYVYPGDGTGNGGLYDLGAPFAPANGDRICIAYDTTADKVWFAKNGSFNGNPAAGTGGYVLPAGTTAVYAMLGMVPLSTGTPTQLTINFGATAFTYTPPSGFTAML